MDTEISKGNRTRVNAMFWALMKSERDQISPNTVSSSAFSITKQKQAIYKGVVKFLRL